MKMRNLRLALVSLALCLQTYAEKCGFRNQSLRAIPVNFGESCSEIDLSRNKILSVDAEAFVNLPSLSELNLSANQISSFSSRAILNCPNLKVLWLTNNKLTEFPDIGFGVKQSLITLYIHSSRISSIGSRRLSGFPKLQQLHLSRNPIVEVASDAISDLPALSVLLTSLPSHLLRHFFPDRCQCHVTKLILVRYTEFPDLHLFENVTSLSINQMQKATIALENLPDFTRLHDLEFGDSTSTEEFNNYFRCDDCETRASLVKLGRSANSVNVYGQLCAPPNEGIRNLNNLEDCEQSPTTSTADNQTTQGRDSVLLYVLVGVGILIAILLCMIVIVLIWRKNVTSQNNATIEQQQMQERRQNNVSLSQRNPTEGHAYEGLNWNTDNCKRNLP